MTDAARASVSVVVPVLDDARALAALLGDLDDQRGVALDAIVADGGSRDDAAAVARAHGARWVATGAGRARQMNAGAALATGDWLLFLHADSSLTDARQIADAVAALAAAGARAAGHFALGFARGAPKSPRFYRFLHAKSASGRRYTVNGDQGLLLRRRFFVALGGFAADRSALEDQRMIAAICQAGECWLLPHVLITSARRFEAGGRARVYARMGLTMAMYVANVPAYFERAGSRRGAADDLRALRELAGACGARGGWRVCRRLADVAVGQTWQLALALDVALARACAQPVGRWYQRIGARLIENRPVATLLAAALLAAAWGPLWLWCTVSGLRDSGNNKN